MPNWPDDYINKVICGDCLEVMRGMPDGCVDAVITDPPYGIGEARNNNASRTCLAVSQDYGRSNWDDTPPPPAVFSEMKRVSQEQVIFGGNYFAEWLGNSPSWIVWDKDNGATDFADCELVWTSHRRAVRMIRYRWHGMLQGDMRHKEQRHHPTPRGLRERDPASVRVLLEAPVVVRRKLYLGSHHGGASIPPCAHLFTRCSSAARCSSTPDSGATGARVADLAGAPQRPRSLSGIGRHVAASEGPGQLR